MTTMQEVQDYLEHHGIKGMKWGVRRDPRTGIRPIANTLAKSGFGRLAEKNLDRHNRKITAKADHKWEKKVPKAYFDIYNHMAGKMNDTEIDRINKDPRFKSRSMKNMNSPVTKAYHKEYSQTCTRILNAESKKTLGTNASGTKEVKWDYDVTNDAFPRMMIVDVKVKHDATDVTNEVEINVKWSDDGHILGLTIPDSVEHSVDPVEKFLAHHGVKGMRWGVRNKRRTPSADAQRHATAGKKHLSELDDKELQQYINRLNMQQQYKRLNPTKMAKGHTAVKAALAVGVTANAVVAFGKTPTGRALATGLAKKTRAFNPALGGLKKLG